MGSGTPSSAGAFSSSALAPSAGFFFVRLVLPAEAAAALVEVAALPAEEASMADRLPPRDRLRLRWVTSLTETDRLSALGRTGVPHRTRTRTRTRTQKTTRY